MEKRELKMTSLEKLRKQKQRVGDEVLSLPEPRECWHSLLHQAATGEGGKRQTVKGEVIWEGTGKLEAKMCFRKIVLTGTCGASRIK